ncbi:hypothetical protein MAR_003920 [Mya arenaria]|uniref:Uncharacterized protein n=1 Tax=Mya arenaria TaxID=6604 RepID=A0ABY7EVF1_MYAAR|nr:hypothetical protein MAR_003920 [Mya arenaria]
MVNIRPERESGSWSDDWMTSPEIDEEAPLLAGTTMTSPRRESQCDTPTSQRGSQNSGRDRKVVLDLEDTTRLYHYMDEAAEFLLYQLDQENSRERRMSLFTDRPPRCAKVKAALSKVMIALTGAKGISATVLLQPSSWKFVADPQVLEDPVQIVVLYTRFLFFSVSTATLCGFIER